MRYISTESIYYYYICSYYTTTVTYLTSHLENNLDKQILGDTYFYKLKESDKIDIIHAQLLGFGTPQSHANSQNALVHYSTLIKELLWCHTFVKL